MMKKEEVVVVIPVHKEHLDEYEQISFIQATNILKEYQITLVAPEGFRAEDYSELTSKEIGIEIFDPRYFKSIQEYSKLCCSKDFYNRFSQYKYMLIYQLDAFVFCDKLLEFCEKGYDYIGAPVPHVLWPFIGTRIGNGGFSLRKIKTMLRIVDAKSKVKETLQSRPQNEKEEIYRNEDQFIALSLLYLKERGIDITMPSEADAYRFAIEFNIDGIYEGMKDHLPFGTHRWHTNRFDDWWPAIEAFGYSLSDDYKAQLKKKDVESAYIEQVMDAMIKSNNKLVNIAYKRCFGGSKVSVWGMGKQSEGYINEINRLGLEVINKYDKKLWRDDNTILAPEKEILLKEKLPIVITSSKYSEEIERELIELNKIRNRDYFFFHDIRQILRESLEIKKYGERT